MINTTCPAKDCVERLEGYPPFCHLHWKIVPWAVAADLNIEYQPEKVKQRKRFRELVERATTFIDELVDELLAARDRKGRIDMGHHLTPENEFMSDKYKWCPTGYFALSFKDPLAWSAIEEYARTTDDVELREDLLKALETAGAN